MGWLEEHSKLENTRAAALAPHLLDSKSWPVKFRLINRDTVLPGQTLLFMRDQTLEERKLEAYVLLKILKYCTGSSARSYQCKFDMDQSHVKSDILLSDAAMDEDEMLKKAIAMSLEEERGVGFAEGEQVR